MMMQLLENEQINSLAETTTILNHYKSVGM
jgi:hypothetical protein